MHRSLRVVTLLLTVVASLQLSAQTPVSYDRLRNAAKEPQNWLNYGGDYFSSRYSALTQITPANVKSLNLAWVYQAPVAGSWQPTPIVADGIMYLTQRPNDVIALDAATGRVFWIYRHTNEDVLACCGSNNRGVAILGETLFMGTLDGHLVAIDAKSGRQVWKTRVADSKQGYSVTVAPLAIKDRVVIGVGGGEFGIRGYISAYHAQTGKELWRFYTIPGPGEPGHETWEACPPDSKTYCDPEAWKHGGASVWVTGSYDPELNLTYWGTGNAGPDYNADQRPGDNLYTASVVALDADTGRLRWHYQFTPHDRYDYDSVQVPVTRRHHVARCARESDVVGKPQRQLLRARSGDWKISSRQAVCEAELDERLRRKRTSHTNTATGGHADISGGAGRLELVFTVVQPSHKADVCVDVGRQRSDVRRHADRV